MFRFFALVSLAALIAIPALASGAPSAPADTSVSIGQLFTSMRPAVETLAVVVVTAIVGYLAARLNRFFGISIEARHREALQSALMNGIGAGLDKLGARTGQMTVDVRSQVVAQGIGYVVRSVPDAVRHFGLDEERLATMLRAKLPAFEAGSAAATPAEGLRPTGPAAARA